MAQHIDGFGRVRLADGVSVFQRGPTMVQFGVDATRTGVLEVAQPAAAVRALTDAARPIALHALTAALREALGADASRRIVADLVSYRLLVPAVAPHVVMLGTSPLAARLAALLHECRMAVHAPRKHQPDADFLAGCDERAPLVVVDQLARAGALARMVKHRPGPVVPVATVDSRVLIGPLREEPGNPCLRCINLHLAERDAGWERGVHASPHGPASPDPVVVAAGAAAAAVAIRRVAGAPDPPGVSAPRLQPGQLAVVDPFGPKLVTHHTWAPHPRCTVCY